MSETKNLSLEELEDRIAGHDEEISRFHEKVYELNTRIKTQRQDRKDVVDSLKQKVDEKTKQSIQLNRRKEEV